MAEATQSGFGWVKPRFVYLDRTRREASGKYCGTHRLWRNQLTRVYRVLRKAYSRSPFDGEGSYQYGGRWSSPGTRLSYASEHHSLAMLEYFVHLEASDPPPDLVLACADVPDDLSRQQINIDKLPANWREIPAPAELARLGDEFVQL